MLHGYAVRFAIACRTQEPLKQSGTGKTSFFIALLTRAWHCAEDARCNKAVQSVTRKAGSVTVK